MAAEDEDEDGDDGGEEKLHDDEEEGEPEDDLIFFFLGGGCGCRKYNEREKEGAGESGQKVEEKRSRSDKLTFFFPTLSELSKRETARSFLFLSERSFH